MTKTMQGKVHGRIIKLDEDPGVAEGQQVEITIKSLPAKKPWGEGLRRCAGALAGIPGLDEDMEQILQELKTAKFREVPE